MKLTADPEPVLQQHQTPEPLPSLSAAFDLSSLLNQIDPNALSLFLGAQAGPLLEQRAASLLGMEQVRSPPVVWACQRALSAGCCVLEALTVLRMSTYPSLVRYLTTQRCSWCVLSIVLPCLS